MTSFRQPGNDDDDRTVTPTTRQPATTPTRAPPPPVTAPATLPSTSPYSVKPRRHIIWRVLRVLILAVLVATVTLLTVIIAYRWVNPPMSTLMLSQRLSGVEISHRWVDIERVSLNLITAVVVSEDSSFCRHRGVDWHELEAAYERGQEGDSTGGASTISMQAIKNLLLWPSRSYLRKALEIPLTLTADALWSKRRMLELYLNIVELGPGIFGAEAAARHYFNKPARNLTSRESALLATALPKPLARNASEPTNLHRRLAARIEVRMRAVGKQIDCIKN